MRLTVSHGMLAGAYTRCGFNRTLCCDPTVQPQLPNIVSELRGKSPPAPTAVPLRQLSWVSLSLPLLFLRGERHFHGCFTCSRHAGCHFAARECKLLRNSRGSQVLLSEEIVPTSGASHGPLYTADSCTCSPLGCTRTDVALLYRQYI